MPEWEPMKAFLNDQRGRVRYVFAPFIQEEALEFLLADCDAQTVIVTRWLADDLRSGASDIRAYDAAQKRGWTFMIHPRIHLKAYTWDLANAFVGSANVSNRALGFKQASNEELMLGPIALPVRRRLQLQRILQEARVVSQEDYERAREWLSQQAIPSPAEGFVLGAPDRSFAISALPMSRSPSRMLAVLNSTGTRSWNEWSSEERACALHDAANYGLDQLGHGIAKVNLSMVRDAFLGAPFVVAIERQLQPCIQFGALKSWIHDNCTDVPIPSRRDLTGNVQALMRWFTDLDPTTYRVDVPGARSERLCNLKRFA